MSAWPQIPLKRLFRIVNGSTPASSEPAYWNGVIYWATPEDIGHAHGKYLAETSRKITEDGYKSCGTSLVSKGSLVLTTRAPVGNLVIADVPLCTNQGCKSLEPFDKERTNSDYFYYLLAGQATELNALARGSTFVELGTDQLGAYKLSAPPFEVQCRIAEMLDALTANLDALIAEKQRLLDLLAEKRRAAIADFVTHGLNADAPRRDSGIPWLGEIPVHWDVTRARFLFSESALPVCLEDQMVTCFRDGEVTLRSNRREEGFTNAVLELGYQGIRKGQLVLHSMDAFAGAIGVSDSNGKCSPEYVICDPMTDKTDSYYYALLLREMALRNFIQASCPAVRERAPRIRFNDFKDFWLPVPPIDEQRAIVAKVADGITPINALFSETTNTIVLLQERRSALISAAVTGKLKLPTPMEAPCESTS